MTVAEYYDGFLFDLDGTVYEGAQPIASAQQAIASLHAPIMYVTNNASRHADTVCEQLAGMGLEVTAEMIMTSAMAGAALLSTVCQPGATVLVLGTVTLAEVVADAGYVVTRTANDNPAAVIHGHNPETGWAELSEAALAIRAGAAYVATNRDATLPAERGLMVGNGSMIQAVVNATGVEPIAAGKPEPAMFTIAAEKLGASRPLSIGDRLDTDILGGNAAGQDTLLVFTGVSGPLAALAAPQEQRPTLVADDLSCLHSDREALVPQPRGGFQAAVEDSGVLTLTGGSVDAPALAGVHTLLAAAWESATPVQEIVAEGSIAQQVVDALW
ncbi:HAD-IIA family hydrolase [Corynebacterium choanae]|uniref:Putative hydrolase YutF n=1 Tax=Corynebacterium choanae TaxID=1862358 RepID=A0A3G6J5V3_9CORY|nr:HAD-IIA family hydrolase [Corynebacterium choanae]AZA13481.1 putative hydrolase YutF [Corynebacterium choanae]